MKYRVITIIICFLSNIAFAQTQTDSFASYQATIPGSSVTFSMQAIPGGNFLMGSPGQEAGRKGDEGKQHQVQLAGFWLGAHEVTYDEFLLFFNDEQASRNSDVDAVTRPTPQYIDLSWGMGKQGGFPVNSMSQHTAMMYCRWLYRKTGIFYRLPTEAEWEYACRAGTQNAYYFGDDAKLLKEYAWFDANSNNKYQKVGLKKPNAWGLYDMLGNVAEWTLDQYDENYYNRLADGVVDPINPPGNTYPKSVRGGSYLDKPESLRCASRAHSEPSWNRRDPQIPKSKWWLTDAMSVGFRVLRPQKAPGAEEIEKFYEQYLK